MQQNCVYFSFSSEWRGVVNQRIQNMSLSCACGNIVSRCLDNFASSVKKNPISQLIIAIYEISNAQDKPDLFRTRLTKYMCPDIEVYDPAYMYLELHPSSIPFTIHKNFVISTGGIFDTNVQNLQTIFQCAARMANSEQLADLDMKLNPQSFEIAQGNEFMASKHACKLLKVR